MPVAPDRIRGLNEKNVSEPRRGSTLLSKELNDERSVATGDAMKNGSWLQHLFLKHWYETIPVRDFFIENIDSAGSFTCWATS